MEQRVVPGKATITHQDNNIIIIKMLPLSEIHPIDAREIVKVASEMSGDKVHCILTDVSEMTFVGGDARAVFAEQEKSTIPAVAIVNRSKFRISFVNLYLKFTRPIIPTRAFESVETASEWLLEQMK